MAQTGTRVPDRSGFALMAVLVTVAVIAILAGVLGPMAYRQMMQAREMATLEELSALQDGLLVFMEDTGRFPTDDEGLAALADDPGVAGWQGPYMVGDRYQPSDEITTDAFGQEYRYDLSPLTDPPGDTDIILVSGGVNRSITIGDVGDIWSLDNDEDDLVRLINAGPTQRDQRIQAQEEMQALGHAAQKYFEHHTTFPVSTAALDAEYLDGSFAGGAFVDPWLRGYILTADNLATPPTLSIQSRGPDRIDEAGGGDDLTLVVSSVVPGRKSTSYMIPIAQAALDARPATVLTGDWTTDLVDLDLTAAFTNDGWGHPYELVLSTRRVLSAGPDADYFTAADNIPPGVIPDGGAAEEDLE